METVNLHKEKSNHSLDNLTRDQIGGAFAVREFFCKEMGVDEHEAENMRIIRTFRTKEQDTSLYVEFSE